MKFEMTRFDIKYFRQEQESSKLVNTIVKPCHLFDLCVPEVNIKLCYFKFCSFAILNVLNSSQSLFVKWIIFFWLLQSHEGKGNNVNNILLFVKIALWCLIWRKNRKNQFLCKLSYKFFTLIFWQFEYSINKLANIWNHQSEKGFWPNLISFMYVYDMF
jgi:hypothetical protein